MRDGKWFPYIFVFFIGIFDVRKVQCYLSVQVTVLLEKGISLATKWNKNKISITNIFLFLMKVWKVLCIYFVLATIYANL